MKNKLVSAVQDGSVTLQAFINVKEYYSKQFAELDRNDPRYEEMADDLLRSGRFVQLFIDNYEKINNNTKVKAG